MTLYELSPAWEGYAHNDHPLAPRVNTLDEITVSLAGHAPKDSAHSPGDCTLDEGSRSPVKPAPNERSPSLGGPALDEHALDKLSRYYMDGCALDEHPASRYGYSLDDVIDASDCSALDEPSLYLCRPSYSPSPSYHYTFYLQSYLLHCPIIFFFPTLFYVCHTRDILVQ